ncbi:MAG: hypothetical protein KJ666_18970, partial [Bacteroidetes bacterium]|nr:hypothetical protein [Bacteroidota bacterium]
MPNNWKPIRANLQISPLSTYETRDFYQARTANGRFVKISPEVKVLLNLMDGNHTVDEIVVIANKQYDANLTVECLEELLRSHMIPAGLVESDGTFLPSRSSYAIHVPLVRGGTLRIIGQWCSGPTKLDSFFAILSG